MADEAVGRRLASLRPFRRASRQVGSWLCPQSGRVRIAAIPHNEPMSRPVFVGEPASIPARRAATLGATVVGSAEESLGHAAPIHLEMLEGRLHARISEWPRAAAFRVEFDSSRMAGARRSPLVKAAGSPPGVLLDATAGFGGDAMAFASAGWTVIAIERNPWIHWLLEDGLATACDDPRLEKAAGRITLRHADAGEVLEALSQSSRVDGVTIEAPIDVVLLDPMFPAEARGKSALPPKSAQLLRAIAGEACEAATLLDLARRACTRRVVVKRPPWAEPLRAGVESTRETKLLRIDSYRPER